MNKEVTFSTNLGHRTGFSVNGPAIGQDGLLLGVGLDAGLAKDLKVSLQYQGELLRTNLTSNQFGGGIGLAL